MDEESPDPTPGKRRRRRPTQAFFLRGLITVLPVVFTIFILVTAYRFVTQYLTGPVNSIIYWSLEDNALGWKALSVMGIDPYGEDYLEPLSLPVKLQGLLLDVGYEDLTFQAALTDYREENASFFRDFQALAISPPKLRRDVVARVPEFVGLVATLLIVLSLGSLAGGFLGRRIIHRGERALLLIPVVRSIYPYAKQLVDFFLAERQIDFDTVVAVPYPSKGLWSTGFVTSSCLKTLREATGENLVSVFIPSSPMPMTGYTVYIPAERLVPLPITVDEALRVVVSGGVLIPPHEQVQVTSSEVMARIHPKKVSR